MYVLDQRQFRCYRPQQVQAFVKCWQEYYEYAVHIYGTTTPIDYFAELNVGRPLTDENVKRLLRWKDPKYLTSQDGKLNPRVARVTAALSEINRFRSGSITETSFKLITHQVYPHGLIWQAFLFHMARPSEYPIFDQHVLRAMSAHTGTPQTNDWSRYEAYIQYFRSLARACGVPIDDNHLPELKALDNALMAFGQFLKKYDR